MGDLTNNGDRKETYMMGIVFFPIEHDGIWYTNDMTMGWSVNCEFGVSWHAQFSDKLVW